MIQPGNYSVVGYRLACLSENQPEPDATTRKAWFKDVLPAYQGIPESEPLLRREVKAEICAFFQLTDQQFDSMAGNGPQTRRIAPQQPKEPPLDQQTAIELELLRRAYDSQEERDWWVGRESLLGMWGDDAMSSIIRLLSECENEAQLEILAEKWGDAITTHLTALHFMDAMPESTPYLVARHYNLTIPARMKALAELYALSKDPSDLRALTGLKPLNPEDWK